MKKILLLLLLVISTQVFSVSIPLSSNFTVNTALPIEDRMSVADITARNAIPTLRRWEGMLVYVVADGKHYTLIGGVADTDWSELSGAGGGGGGEMKYLFSSTNSDIAGYESMPSLPSFIAGALVNPSVSVTTTPTILEEFATNLGFPNATVIPAGTFTAHFETQKASGANNYYTFFEVYKRTSGGVETLLATSDNSTTTAVNTVVSTDLSALVSSNIVILPTDRLVVKVYAVMVSSSANIELRYDDNTLSGFNMPTATVDATNFVPYNGAVSDLDLGTKNIKAANYDKEDLLVNGNFENALGAEWTCTTGTASRTSVSGEVAKDLSALKITSGTGTTIRCYQTVATLSGAPVQHYVRGFYKFLLADLPDFQICTLINGNLLANEQNCIPTSSLVGDNTYRPFEIPIVALPGQVVGVVFKTTATSTAKSAFLDTISLKQGLGTQNIILDNVYSAQVSTTGVVSAENTDWINGNCSISDTSLFTCPITKFTVKPNCTAIPVDTTDQPFSFEGAGSSASQWVIRTGYSAGSGAAITKASYAFNIVCQKSGNDYLASSANVYSSTNGNTNPTSFTPTYTGGASYTTEGAFWWREGEVFENESYWDNYNSGASAFSIALPNGYTIDSTVEATTADTASVGQMYRIVGTTANAYPTTTYGAFPAFTDTASSSTVIYFSRDMSGARFGKGAGTTFFASGDRFRIEASVPISGWSNSNVIVGSFQGYNSTPGVNNPKFYSAQVSSTGVVSNEKGNWINGDCTVVATSQYPCVFNSGVFTTVPNCFTTQNNALDTMAFIMTPATSSGITIRTTRADTTVSTASAFTLSCHGE